MKISFIDFTSPLLFPPSGESEDSGSVHISSVPVTNPEHHTGKLIYIKRHDLQKQNISLRETSLCLGKRYFYWLRGYLRILCRPQTHASVESSKMQLDSEVKRMQQQAFKILASTFTLKHCENPLKSLFKRSDALAVFRAGERHG